MKRFLIKLIATTLLLIIAFSSFGCDYDGTTLGESLTKTKMKYNEKYTTAYESIEKDIDGYKLVITEDNSQILAENEKHVINGVTFSYYGLGQNSEKLIYGPGTGDELIDEYYFGKIVVSIYDENDTVTKEIMIDYEYLLGKCQKVKDIYNKCREFKERQQYTCPTALIKFEDKIFIYCKGYMTPKASLTLSLVTTIVYPTILLFDIQTEEVKYAGFYSATKEKEYLQNYTIVKE